jgi:hypothetical protein
MLRDNIYAEDVGEQGDGEGISTQKVRSIRLAGRQTELHSGTSHRVIFCGRQSYG